MIKKILKLISFIFIAVLLVFFGYHIYKLVNPTYVTERAVLYTMPDSISCSGIIIRDEMVVEFDTDGTLNFKVDDGQKVAANSVVASVYRSATIAEDVMIYEILMNEREALLKAKEASLNVGMNLDSISNNIQQTMVYLSRSIEKGDYLEAIKQRNKLTEQIYPFVLSVYENVDIELPIDRINQEINKIEGRLAESIEDISIDTGGYFVSYIDNLEYLKVVDGDIVRIIAGEEETTIPLSISDVEKIIESTEYTPNRNSCKVISNYVWYFAAVVDSNYVHRFHESQSLKLDLNHSFEYNLPVTIERIITDDSSEKAIILFSCDRINEQLTGMRIADAGISFRDYTGIRVPRSAVHVVDGEIGVFIKYDNKMLFKKISYDFDTEDYLLVNPSSNSDELRLYDEIIIEGKDLYDGKGI